MVVLAGPPAQLRWLERPTGVSGGGGVSWVPAPPQSALFPLITPGWVVTWFLLGYTVRMFEYTIRTFWSNVGRFLYVFSSILIKLYAIFQPTFSPIKRYQDSIFKLLALSTNSVTKVVRTAYFQVQAWSSPLKFCDRVCTQSKKLYEDMLALLDQGKWGLENGV